MTSTASEFLDDLKLVETVIIFTVFAILFSLARSFLDWPVGIVHATIPAGLFFIFNALKYIYEEWF